MFWDKFEKLCAGVGKKPNPVAKELGISSSTITKWKAGSVPSGSSLQKLSSYFGVTADYLLNEEETDPLTAVFWKTFTYLCKQHNEMPSEAVESIGMPESTVEAWSMGAQPSFTALVKLAEHFHTTVDYLLGKKITAPVAESGISIMLDNLTNDEIIELRNYLRYLEYKREYL